MRIGVDFGGTKIEAALMDRSGVILARRRAATPRDYAGAIRAVADLAAEVERAAGALGRAAGVAIPGSVSRKTGLVRNANTTFLNGRAMEIDLASALARPVRLANDANCFALSEAVDGAGASARVVFGLILGTGCGGGVVIDKRPVSGFNRIAGEWGHLPLPWPRPDEQPGPECWCGRRGCMEAWVCGPAVRRWAQIDPAALASGAAEGDVSRQAQLALLADRIARGLALVADILDPHAFVIGGGLSNIDALYPRIAERLPLYAFTDSFDTPILKNRHGDSSGVRGAAWLWRPEDLE